MLGGDPREVLLAVVSKISIDLPGLPKIVGSLDQHRRRSEGFEADDDMGEVELRFEVEAYRHVLHSIFRLPPGPANNIFDIVLLLRQGCIAEEALFPVLQMRNDAVSFWSVEAASGRSV